MKDMAYSKDTQGSKEGMSLRLQSLNHASDKLGNYKKIQISDQNMVMHGKNRSQSLAFYHGIMAKTIKIT